jgi:hypothetical protein
MWMTARTRFYSNRAQKLATQVPVIAIILLFLQSALTVGLAVGILVLVLTAATLVQDILLLQLRGFCVMAFMAQEY